MKKFKPMERTLCLLQSLYGDDGWSFSLRNWLKLGETAKAMVYIHYATTHDYGFSRQHYEFNVNARLQKTFLKGQLTAVLFANDIFRTLRDKWEGYYPVEVL
ncbi:MAG: outer membrane beta-barrel protein, partial [Prevotella sp.]|nr:outer membrane beta-barrel protein [Prevotella sp.]